MIGKTILVTTARQRKLTLKSLKEKIQQAVLKLQETRNTTGTLQQWKKPQVFKRQIPTTLVLVMEFTFLVFKSYAPFIYRALEYAKKSYTHLTNVFHVYLMDCKNIKKNIIVAFWDNPHHPFWDLHEQARFPTKGQLI